MKTKVIQQRVLNDINLFLNKCDGCTGEYWPEIFLIQTECSEVCTKMTKGQYSPVWLRLARLGSS